MMKVGTDYIKFLKIKRRCKIMENFPVQEVFTAVMAVVSYLLGLLTRGFNKKKN